MTPEQEKALQEHIQAIAKILYDDTSPEGLKTLGGIEQAVRSLLQRHVMPQVGVFLSQQQQGQQRDTDDNSKVSWESCRKHKPASAAVGCAVAHTIESVSRNLLSAGECECLL